MNKTPFQVPTNAQLFGYVHWQKQNHHRKTHRSNEAKKSYSPTQPIDRGPITITDIDPEYFTDVAGRPIRERLSKKQYIEQIRKIFHKKLTIGYERDECMKIDEDLATEQKRLDALKRRYHHFVSAFEEYLSTDYESCMQVVDTAQKEAENSHKLVVKRDELLKKFGQVRLKLYQWEEKWQIAKMCHEFVQKISPSEQLDDEEENDKKPSRIDESQVTDEEKDFDLGSLEDIIETFKKDISDEWLQSKEMHMNDPLELSRIFSTMELRNLDALIHLESLAKPMDEMSSSVARAEELVEKEVGSIKENIEELKALILSSEERAVKLESYADYLIQEVFRELVCSEPVLHLRVFIEDAYETCVGPNDASLDDYSMMRAIEKTYESLNMSLDNLPLDIVKNCEKLGFAQEMRTIREAEDAAKKFDRMNRLVAVLERNMKPIDTSLKRKSVVAISKIKLTSSRIMPETSKHEKEKFISTQLRKFFTEDCDSKDIDIRINSIIDELRRQSDGKAHSQVSSLDNEADCRDDVS